LDKLNHIFSPVISILKNDLDLFKVLLMIQIFENDAKTFHDLDMEVFIEDGTEATTTLGSLESL
jgi:hypothetical protein